MHLFSLLISQFSVSLVLPPILWHYNYFYLVRRTKCGFLLVVTVYNTGQNGRGHAKAWEWIWIIFLAVSKLTMHVHVLRMAFLNVTDWFCNREGSKLTEEKVPQEDRNGVVVISNGSFCPKWKCSFFWVDTGQVDWEVKLLPDSRSHPSQWGISVHSMPEQSPQAKREPTRKKEWLPKLGGSNNYRKYAFSLNWK